ncbi:flagellar assembly protein FliW [Paenibacillus lemnae]|uniref:Flagellar assembly factor FliW n=1 Tax=Paenibacillus lemnae TaxID=1330551 RepID=A0A848M6K2_PAELE|nr:flagellar assembly protein FliW [Paenibacillus lemnae]NMO96617.1 flagellar assembly protein FliW [Paenibacillus lemnae]
MMIQTMAWGSLEVDESQKYQFNKGMPGFEQETEFVLIPFADEPFSYLQSLKNKDLAFLLADPFQFYPNYEFELPEEEANELQIDGNVVIRCVLTLKDQVEQSSINLLAPLVMNPDQHMGKQIVLHKSPYQTRHPLWSQSIDVEGSE